MKRNLFTKNEIIICTYIAKYGRNEFDENDIHKLNERSVSSIKMKVQNIASMLNEQGFSTDPSISKLSGVPLGKKPRMTNWDIVEKLADLNKKEFLRKFEKIIS